MSTCFIGKLRLVSPKTKFIPTGSDSSKKYTTIVISI